MSLLQVDVRGILGVKLSRDDGLGIVLEEDIKLFCNYGFAASLG